MKNKFFKLIISFFLIIPCMFMFSACSLLKPTIEFKVEDGYIINLLGERKNKEPYKYNS